jgi:hypothetical protein
MLDYEIEVVEYNKDKEAQYLGLSSPLGNPYPVRSESERNIAVDKYEQWFYKTVEQDPEVRTELRRLHTLGKQRGKLKLGCFTAPNRCHCHVVKQYLETSFDKLEFKKSL